MEEDYELSFYERTEEINDGADDDNFREWERENYGNED